MLVCRAASVLCLMSPWPAFAVPQVIADIAPVHSLVSRVMEGVGEPELLLPPGASPHDYALQPSDAAALEAADLVFWVGEAYTPWLADPISTLAAEATQIVLQEAPGIALLAVRASGPFEQHEHEHGHEEGAIDGHLWLDPENAAAIGQLAAAALAESDPENAETYRENAVALRRELDALTEAVGASLEPAKGKSFVVFHDAYQYFEHRFGVPASGSIALHDADQPSAARMSEIRAQIRGQSVVCVFSEPQFPPSLAETVAEGTGARRGTLDPIGSELKPGPDFYPSLLRDLADDFAACITDASESPAE